MAGWLIKRLGNGLFGLIDIENPEASPSITASITAPAYDSFTRIILGQVEANEELRREAPLSYTSGYEYIGLGPNGSNTNDLVWDVVRMTWVNNKKTRMQYRANISWDDKASGWL